MQNNGFNLELNLKTLCCFWLQIKWLQKDLIHHDFKNLNFRPGCRETQNLSGHFATSKNVSNSLILAGLYDEKHETGTFQFSRVCKSYPPPWAVRGGGGGWDWLIPLLLVHAAAKSLQAEHSPSLQVAPCHPDLHLQVLGRMHSP